MSPPLPNASKKSPRVYRNLQTKDLENVTFSDMEATGNPLSIELHNEDELRRLVLVQLARLTCKSEWTGLLTSSSGGMTSFDLSADTGSAETVTNGNTVKIAGGTGIDTAVGPVDTVTVTNSGVTSLTAGSNITLSGSTGAVTVSASSSTPTQSFDLSADSGTPQTIPTNGTGSLTVTGGTAISTVAGATDQVTINNDGVTSLVAGTNITLSGSTGAVTVSASGGGGSTAFTVPLPTEDFPDATPSSYDKFIVSNYAPYALSTSNVSAQYTLNTRPTAFPFISPVDGEIDKGHMRIETTAESGTKIYVAIYKAGSNNYPDSKIVELEFDGNSSGSVTGAPTSSQSEDLVAGTLYYYSFWFVYVGSGVFPVVKAISNQSCLGFLPTSNISSTNQSNAVRGTNLTSGTSQPSTFSFTGGNPQTVNRPIFAFDLA